MSRQLRSGVLGRGTVLRHRLLELTGLGPPAVELLGALRRGRARRPCSSEVVVDLRSWQQPGYELELAGLRERFQLFATELALSALGKGIL